MNIFPPKDIKIHVRNYFYKYRSIYQNMVIIDIPAGSGASSTVLKEIGAKVYPYDLFPEFFKVEGLQCLKVDIMNKIPVDNGFADYLLCQEGMEHFSDQLKVLKEFNRVLKKGGTALITTPNYSNLKSKLSYLLAESEYLVKLMPPNEIDSVWMRTRDNNNEIYLGHIFLLGIQKLRIIAKLAGFSIKKINFVRLNKTSLYLFPLFYPILYLVNRLSYYRAMRKRTDIPYKERKNIYREVLSYNLNSKILLDAHLFVELKKECETAEVAQTLYSKYPGFDMVT